MFPLKVALLGYYKYHIVPQTPGFVDIFGLRSWRLASSKQAMCCHVHGQQGLPKPRNQWRSSTKPCLLGEFTIGNHHFIHSNTWLCLVYRMKWFPNPRVFMRFTFWTHARNWRAIPFSRPTCNAATHCCLARVTAISPWAARMLLLCRRWRRLRWSRPTVLHRLETRRVPGLGDGQR